MATNKTKNKTTSGKVAAALRNSTAGTTTVDDLYDAMIDAHAHYSADLKPLAFFLVAFRRFLAVAKIERRARFRDALEPFQAFVNRSGELDDNEDAEGVWRLFLAGVSAVDKYDRAVKASKTPPTRSIDELIALGVPMPQIAKIYGFKRADGSPDVDAVERRDAWQPTTLADDVDALAVDDAEEIARLAVDALDKIVDDGIDVDPETVASLESLIPQTTETPEEIKTPEEIDASIRREILDGVPVRQIAARHGLTADEIKQRADSLGVVASTSSASIPPRVVKLIEARRAEIESGQTTFQAVADSVSASDRRVTSDDVRRVLGKD